MTRLVAYIPESWKERIRMKETKYAVFPGKIRSKSDGDIHYISAEKLIRLYGVDPKECLIISDDRDLQRQRHRIDGLVQLHPRYHGDYKTKDDKKI